MDPNLAAVPAFTSKDLLLRKLYHPVTCSVLSQVVILQVYLFIVNFNLFHPIQWIQTAVSTMTYVTTWIFVLFFLAVVFLQSIVCAKDYVISSSYSKNRFKKFISVFSIHNVVLLTLHLVIGGTLVWLFLSLGGGPYEHFVYSCKQHGRCLNEGKLFVILGGVLTGLYYFVKIYVSGKHLMFPVIQQTKLIQFKTRFLPLLKESMYQSCWPTLYFILFYFYWGFQLRSRVAYSLKVYNEGGDSAFWMCFTLWLMGTLYFFSMNLMRFFFNLFVTEPVQFPLVKTCDNALTLQEAVLMEDLPIVQNLACKDLYQLACWSKHRRQVLFTLSQPGGHPHNWNTLITNALKFLTNYTNLLNQSMKSISEKTAQPTVHVSDLYSPRPADTWQSPLKYGNMRNMSLYCSPQVTNAATSPQKSPTEMLQNVDIVKKIAGRLNTFISVCRTIFGINYLFGELPQIDIQKCLANGNVIIWMCQGLSQLCVASLKEDKYGIVQKDLPVLLTALVQLKQSLEKLSKIPALSRRIASYDDYSYKMKNSVLSAVKRSIHILCLHFGEYIEDFPLSKEVMQQLQAFIVKGHD